MFELGYEHNSRREFGELCSSTSSYTTTTTTTTTAMMRIHICVALLASLILVSNTRTTVAAEDAVTIVNLSQDFEIASLDTRGAQAIRSTAALLPEIRTALVLEKGKIVADYARDDVNPKEPYQVWAATRSWMSLLFGIMVEDGAITLTETLGEIFTNDTAWTSINDTSTEELEFKRNVSIYEIMTMTSGLVSPTELGDEDASSALLPGGDGGGGSLQDSLAFPLVGVRGEFNYLAVSNILSYVLTEKTGKSPREYLADKVLPALGMMDSEIDWWQNADGMEYAYHGLELDATQMAKLGQLYLQGGLSAPDQQLVSKEWIADSTSPQVQAYVENPAGQGLNASYGYFFWIINGESFGVPNIGEFYCAVGYGGQDICVSPEFERVSVQQRDSEDGTGNFIMTLAAFDPSLSFQESGTENTTDTTSGAVSKCPFWFAGALGLIGAMLLDFLL